MRRSPRLAACALTLLAMAVAISCGGPTDPSGQGVVLRGRIVAAGTAVADGVSIQSAREGAVITVTVAENPTIQTTVGADGTFTLRGLPEGSFTLLFSVDGGPTMAVAFAEVKPNQEITVTVRLDGSTVTVIDQQRNGIGHGDVEIEGNVTAATPNPASDSVFVIAGRTVVARPGQTAIREGNTARSVNDVTVGRHVHVKGVYLPAQGTQQSVLAHEIKLQGGGDTGPGEPGRTCIINGGRVGDRIELEGNVASGDASGFMLTVNGNRATGPVTVATGGASFECSPQGGPNAPTPDQCRASVTAGAKVHVRGTLQSCDLSTALVQATVVMVQK